MKKKAWIVYNGNLSATKFLDFAEWIQAAALKENVQAKILKNNELLAALSVNGGSLLGYKKSELPDFVVFGDKDIPLARQLEYLSIPVFNSASAIERSDNKIETYQALAHNQLPIPKTIVAPKVFSGATVLQTTFYQQVGEELTFPLIIKEAYGSFGEQVYLIESVEQMMEKIIELKDTPFVFQEYIATSYGRDIRLNVVGDKVVTSILRVSKNDFRANVSAGGQMERYQPSPHEEQLAIAATKAVGADFAGVDLLFGANNDPIICEVNSNAHIRNIYNCTKVNVAEYIVSYILDQLK
jgi:gamma-F420-2:alpha-L-glutamate ligase